MSSVGRSMNCGRPEDANGCSRPSKDAIVPVHDWRYAFMVIAFSASAAMSVHFSTAKRAIRCRLKQRQRETEREKEREKEREREREKERKRERERERETCIDVVLDPVSLCLSTLCPRLVFRSLSPFLPPSVFRYLVTRRAITHTTPWYAHSHQLIHTHAHALTRAPALSPSVWALARSLSMTRSHVRSCFVSVLYGSLPLSLSLSRSLAVSLSYFPMLTVSRSLSLVLYLLCRPRSWESPWESPCSIDKQKILMKNKKKRETHEEIPTHVEWQRKS